MPWPFPKQASWSDIFSLPGALERHFVHLGICKKNKTKQNNKLAAKREGDVIRDLFFLLPCDFQVAKLAF